MAGRTAGIALWILAASLPLLLLPSRTHCQEPLDGQPSSSRMHIEKQRYDGWYNNLAHQDWGAVESQLVRKAPSSYADGVYMIPEGRPSARSLSQELFKGEDGLPSTRNITVLFVFFGQVISSEILMASEPGCPIEFHRIPISRCDEMYDSKCTGARYMPFHRAHYDVKTGQSPNNPREQVGRPVLQLLAPAAEQFRPGNRQRCGPDV